MKTALQIRVSIQERDEIRARAVAAGLSVSEFVRRRVLEQAPGDTGSSGVAAVVPPLGEPVEVRERVVDSASPASARAPELPPFVCLLFPRCDWRGAGSGAAKCPLHNKPVKPRP